MSRKLTVAIISMFHESTIRRTLNSNDVHGRATRRKPLLSKKNINTSMWINQKNRRPFGTKVEPTGLYRKCLISV